MLKLFDKIIIKAKEVTLPGFDRMPIYDVGVFFVNGIKKGSLTTRASSIAFNLFLAVFPAIIFFFTLIPYIPVENFQAELLKLLQNILPENAYLSIKGTLEDIITHQRGGLLSIGFIAVLYFSTNGINAMIGAFNATYHSFETRSWLAQRLISTYLVLILTFLIATAIVLIVFSETAIQYLVEFGIMKVNITYYLLIFGKWLIILALFFFAISFLYYFAPAKKTEWKFFSAGSTLATILCIVISLGFSFFVNNFGQYNKFYGSVGTLIVLLLLMYFNAIILLIGFELNASIKDAHLEKKKISLRG